jgi:hypothetical protein
LGLTPSKSSAGFTGICGSTGRRGAHSIFALWEKIIPMLETPETYRLFIGVCGLCPLYPHKTARKDAIQTCIVSKIFNRNF